MNKMICVLLTNDYENDSRVKKECLSLSKIYKVDLFCLTKKESKVITENKNWTVYKINFKYPLNKILIFLFGGSTFLNVIKEQNKKYDLIWSNDIDTLKTGYLLKEKFNAKLIYDSHEYWAGVLSNIKKPIDLYIKIYLFLFLKHEKKYISRCDGIISTNVPRKKLLIKNYDLYNYLVDVLHNYPESWQKNKIQCIDSGDKKIRLVYSGVLVERGIENVIKALALIGNKKNYFEFLLMCPEKDYNKLAKSLAFENNLGSTILYKGFVTPEEIGNYESQSDFSIVFYPQDCLNNKFPESNKLYTSLANGCLILTNVRYVADEIKNFGIYTINSPSQIAIVLTRLLKISRTDLTLLKKNAQIFAIKTYNWEEQKLLNIVSKVFR